MAVAQAQGINPLFNPTKILDKDQFYKLMHTGNIDFLKEFVSPACPCPISLSFSL
jgi:hypothetical protein